VTHKKEKIIMRAFGSNILDSFRTLRELVSPLLNFLENTAKIAILEEIAGI